ncbi:uncharacterized protein LOC110703873 [Chenopodium quinoa]|uniref:uncharacterized protein LOC110703873 n=1 Tax=Chenopodium quinoa TaxID=63459 RepID=UPI000B790496|nr:uncharacterized protein LOC110703873 [Chenopodium quinoa]
MNANLANLASNTLLMSCMIWNVQGAGSREFMFALKEIIRVNKPNVIALVETHIGGAQAERIANIIRYNGHTRVDAQGFSSGIWVYWRRELVTVEPIHKHNQFITIEIKRVDGVPWYFTAVYGSPDPSKRQELWRELKDYAANHNVPWMLAEDFNDTRFRWERSSYCVETSRRAARFNEWVEDVGLLEIEFSGASHTWSRGNSVDTWQSSRLDRARSLQWRMESKVPQCFDETLSRNPIRSLSDNYCSKRVCSFIKN